MHRKTCICQGFARSGDHGVLRHADHHHCVLLYRLLHFGDDVLLVLSDGVADGGVDVVGGEYGAVHGGKQSGGEGSLRFGCEIHLNSVDLVSVFPLGICAFASFRNAFISEALSDRFTDTSIEAISALVPENQNQVRLPPVSNACLVTKALHH